MDFSHFTDAINSDRPFTPTERAELTRMIDSLVQDSQRIKNAFLDIDRYNKWAVWSMVAVALAIGMAIGKVL